MNKPESVRIACIAAGIEPELAHAVAVIYERLMTAPSSSEAISEMEKKLKNSFNFKNPPTRRMTASEVCRYVGIEKPTKGDQSLMGHALKNVTQRAATRSNGITFHTLPAPD